MVATVIIVHDYRKKLFGVAQKTYRNEGNLA